MKLKGEMPMLNWNVEERRHWAPQQSYLTGDVLLNLIESGWQIRSIETATSGRAKLHHCTLECEGETLFVRVLDGPAVQDILVEMDQTPPERLSDAVYPR